LARHTGDVPYTRAARISVFYESPPDASVYHSNNIWDAGVSVSGRALGSC
jgi:hypothetical protein